MIATEEFRGRRNHIRERLREAKHGAFVGSTAETIYYLTGVSYEPLERPFFLIVPADEPDKLVVPCLEKDHLAQARGFQASQVFTYWEFPAPSVRSWTFALEQQTRGLACWLCESRASADVAAVMNGFGGQPSDLVETLRLTKSDAEIAMIRHAARFADLGVRQILDYSYYGATVAESFARMSHVTRAIIRDSENCDLLTTKVLMAPFPAPLSATPHAVPRLTDRMLAGPHTALSLTRVNGYAAECERTYFTSEPTQSERELFTLMVRARKLGLSLLRPGASCSEIDQRVNEFLSQEGFGKPEERLHRIGHGIGLGNHEGPWLSEGSSDRLSKGMVISIEPGLYFRGVGGYRHSDTVLVTDDGYELLTSSAGVDEPLVVGKKRLRHRLHSRLVAGALGLKAA